MGQEWERMLLEWCVRVGGAEEGVGEERSGMRGVRTVQDWMGVGQPKTWVGKDEGGKCPGGMEVGKAVSSTLPQEGKC